MNIVKTAVAGALMAMITLLLPADKPSVWSGQRVNQCFSCHTNPGKLIEITREIAKRNTDKPGASAETEGEG